MAGGDFLIFERRSSSIETRAERWRPKRISFWRCYRSFRRRAIRLLRQAFYSGHRPRGIAGLCRWCGGVCHVPGGDGSVNLVPLNADAVLGSFAAAVLGDAGELLEAPLNSQPGADGDRCFDPYTRASGGLVFEPPGNDAQSSARIVP